MAFTLGAIQAATQFFLGQQEQSIDNWTFKMFYQGTVSILVASSVLVSCNQLFGDPIQCDLPRGGVSEKVLKSYCWMYSTFNIPPDFEGECARRRQHSGAVYNSYYQWVPIFLILQSLSFYVPRVIWLMMEGGLMKYLAKGRTDRIVEDADCKVQSLLRTFRDNLENKYTRYTLAFFSCELLNLLNVSVQFYATDSFLQNQFLLYGPLVYRFYQLPPEETNRRDFVNPMCEAFPRVASCTYWKYGSGGRQMGLEAMCILALNIIIDKIYLVLWFWFVLVFFLGAIRVGSRVVQISSPSARYHLMRWKMHRYFKRDKNIEAVKHYIKGCSIGDWFVLYQMSKNLNRSLFYDFLVKMSAESPNGVLPSTCVFGQEPMKSTDELDEYGHAFNRDGPAIEKSEVEGPPGTSRGGRTAAFSAFPRTKGANQGNRLRLHRD